MPVPKEEYVSDVWRKDIFRGQVVFCTGGNGTICSAQVRALVHLGANACIVGRNQEKTQAVARDIATVREGSRVLGIGGIDVRDLGLLEQAAAQCVSELGGIDFVIAGAAGNFLSRFSDVTSNAFRSVLDIDVLGSVNTAKATLPHLVSSIKTGSPRACGRIVFMSATLHYTGFPLQTHAAVAKSGVDALSSNLAIEYGPLGVTSNVISPGPISGTEGVRRLSTSHAQARRIPLGRYGTVRDIADATVYLFSESGSYVNGQVLVVDGGAWRTLATISGDDQAYPEVVLAPKL
ncbi:hypothetical protein ASPVEDRAFT_130382 [Aspergillus versicolor CBS 583.65]|uniref:2,4-dienoyl-CoA reductase [(3E)-enoyl-CoA-producing] n=1 Tax=Aspergillus versicolor CBS 583.65 TaxID=1036611 RepID=A0A1L9PK45_ASPVE|nr:uncharacterized protein ASPVEDRAFT_130382 [Aspergillus versicolor CBS 583.65]OJJ01899.1 hypothetical protein ASPVEDRAFT_130382 [Aspergillus versicolor CBS 583.65]